MAHDSQPPTQDPGPHLASRRSVVKAAWSAPVIVALGMNPIAAFARGAGSSTDMGGSAAPIEKPKGNNGFGNGDQDAPGGSGPNNNAENGPGGNHNGKGKNSANSGNNKNR